MNRQQNLYETQKPVPPAETHRLAAYAYLTICGCSQKGGSYMSQIHISNLTFSYEGSFDNIFENVSFSVDTDWKLGLIGRNGKGKTTFLKLLLGK